MQLEQKRRQRQQRKPNNRSATKATDAATTTIATTTPCTFRTNKCNRCNWRNHDIRSNRCNQSNSNNRQPKQRQQLIDATGGRETTRASAMHMHQELIFNARQRLQRVLIGMHNRVVWWRREAPFQTIICPKSIADQSQDRVLGATPSPEGHTSDRFQHRSAAKVLHKLLSHPSNKVGQQSLHKSSYLTATITAAAATTTATTTIVIIIIVIIFLLNYKTISLFDQKQWNQLHNK